MARSILVPPLSVKGMTVFDKDAFNLNVSVPAVKIHLNDISKICKQNKELVLKLKNITTILKDEEDSTKRIVLLDPDITKEINLKEKLKNSEIEFDILSRNISISYENWPANLLLDRILPDDQQKVGGFSIIGHILHLNLKEHLLPYKHVIGQVLFDKNKYVSLVVNKDRIIDDSDNTFRTFHMEKLAGDNESTEVTVTENGCKFLFDFASVYWNPRLGTEHERILLKLKKYDILYDVMSGVGPFAIPAAKKNCTVLANDLNPHSYNALVNNCKVNKLKDNIECFNLDGKEFIRTKLRDHLQSIFEDLDNYRKIHITMNLPSIAIEFLPSFNNLFEKSFPKFDKEDYKQDIMPYLPLVHVYMFIHHHSSAVANYCVAEQLGYISKKISIEDQIDETELSEVIEPDFKEHIIETIKVRDVSNKKLMFRVSFHLPLQSLIHNYEFNALPCKKLKMG